VDTTNGSDPLAVAADAVDGALRAGRSAIEVASLGDRPRRLVVVDDGSVVGSMGAASLDADVAARAASLIDARAAGITSIPALNGSVDVFVQVHAPLPSIVVIGATDVAVTLVAMAGLLGFDTTVIDGRDRWATRERFPAAGAVSVGMPSELIADLTLAPTTALVLVSHDFKYDLPVLEVALRSRVGYIGVLGSRRRARAIHDFLAGAGVSGEDVARIHIPIGLDIGARTPQEIAISILAQIIAVRGNKRAAGAA
jgi:xanthine dehydrogenase accessory factor